MVAFKGVRNHRIAQGSAALLLTVLAVAALAAQASGGGVGTLRCGPHSSEVETLARGPELRVYTGLETGGLQWVRACGPALPRAVRVGPSRPGGKRWFARIHQVVVRDFWIAAVEHQVEGTDWGSVWLRVFEARSRHLSRCDLGGWAQFDDRKFRLLLSPKGNLAWVSARSGERVLGVCDRRSELTILDEDPTLDLQSVRLDGSLLRWTDATGEHSRTLT